jgi:hypothetical protein
MVCRLGGAARRDTLSRARQVPSELPASAHFRYNAGVTTISHQQNGAAHSMLLPNTIVIQSKPIRTDWIHRIGRGKENGALTCTIWLSVGPVGVYAFKGEDAQTALKLLAGHPAFPAA